MIQTAGEVTRKPSTGACSEVRGETEEALPKVETSLVCPPAVPAHTGLVRETVTGLSHCLPQAAVPQ